MDRRNVLVAIAFLALSLGFVVNPIAATPMMDIVDTAVDAGSFTTLVTASQATGLDTALKGPGPFTVFAPTDEAFAALDSDLLTYLLDNPTELAEVLLYHVVSGNLKAADVLELGCLKTLQGGLLTIDTTSDKALASPLGVRIDGANITVVDIECSNGIIHVIDAVLIPEPEPTCIHPVTAIGWGYVKFRRSTCACARWGWWWRWRWRWTVGLAKLEIYPFNTEKHPGGNPNDEPVCVWVVKLTIRELQAYWTVQSVETKCSYDDDDYDDDCHFVPKIIAYATGHAWTWKGEKLPGAPADIKIVTHHTGAFWVIAYSRGIRFFGKGM